MQREQNCAESWPGGWVKDQEDPRREEESSSFEIFLSVGSVKFIHGLLGWFESSCLDGNWDEWKRVI